MRQFRMRFRAQLARKKSKPSIPLSGREVIAKSAPTILAKPVGVGVASQPWILRREQSELLTHCGDGKRYVVRADEKLTAFMEEPCAVVFNRAQKVTALDERAALA